MSLSSNNFLSFRMSEIASDFRRLSAVGAAHPDTSHRKIIHGLHNVLSPSLIHGIVMDFASIMDGNPATEIPTLELLSRQFDTIGKRQEGWRSVAKQVNDHVDHGLIQDALLEQ